MASTDRIFINKFNGFVYTVRNMIYYGNAVEGGDIPNPKHERMRFVNVFGWESGEEFYDSKNYSFYFSNDEHLKDEFANIYTYKSMQISEMGDCLQLFSALDSKNRESKDICGIRDIFHFNKTIKQCSELAESGSLIIQGKKPYNYRKNVDITDNMSDKEKQNFLTALDFGIKKNNFTSFATTYKKLITSRDNIKSEGCSIDIDHQLFHPILDELHIWEIISAISDSSYVDITYIKGDNSKTELSNILPLRIVYDNLYGRSYLIGYNFAFESFAVCRLDRIFSVELKEKFEDSDWIKNKKEKLNSLLSTAWLVSLNETTEHVVIEFNNTVPLRERVKNEGRHGKITEFNKDYFTFEIDVNDPIEMTNWILNFGSDCVVKEPQMLVDRIIEHLEDMTQ